MKKPCSPPPRTWQPWRRCSCGTPTRATAATSGGGTGSCCWDAACQKWRTSLSSTSTQGQAPAQQQPRMRERVCEGWSPMCPNSSYLREALPPTTELLRHSSHLMLFVCCCCVSNALVTAKSNREMGGFWKRRADEVQAEKSKAIIHGQGMGGLEERRSTGCQGGSGMDATGCHMSQRVAHAAEGGVAAFVRDRAATPNTMPTCTEGASTAGTGWVVGSRHAVLHPRTRCTAGGGLPAAAAHKRGLAAEPPERAAASPGTPSRRCRTKSR